jgi:hypothetical protein
MFMARGGGHEAGPAEQGRGEGGPGVRGGLQPKNEDIQHLAYEVKCRIRSFWLATKMSGNCQILRSDIELPATFQGEVNLYAAVLAIYRSASPTVASRRNDVEGRLHIHRTIRKLRQPTRCVGPPFCSILNFARPLMGGWPGRWVAAFNLGDVAAGSF